MAGHGGFPVEELGRPGDWHPRWCRRPHDGEHRSDTFRVDGRTLYATASPDWARVDVHQAGGGPLTAAQALYLRRAVEYLSDPAGAGR
jgi:hypothetical protein